MSAPDAAADATPDAAADATADAAAEITAPATDQVVVRPFKLLIVSWVSAVLVLAVFGVLAALLPQTSTGVYFRTIDQVAIVLIGLFIAGGLLLMARPRVRADAQGVEVRNILLTRRLSWSEVSRVAFPDGASWARLDFPDDEYLPVMAIQAVDGQRAVDAIRRVRALHTASRT